MISDGLRQRVSDTSKFCHQALSAIKDAIDGRNIDPGGLYSKIEDIELKLMSLKNAIRREL